MITDQSNNELTKKERRVLKGLRTDPEETHTMEEKKKKEPFSEMLQVCSVR